MSKKTRNEKNKKGKSTRRLGYREKALAELKAKYPHYELKSNLLGALFLIGAGLTVWEIYIYRVTFISVYIPLAIWLLTGILMTPFLKKTFNIYCFNPYTPGQTAMFFHYFHNIVSFGGILVFLFMWTNETLNDKSKKTLTLPIVSYGHLPNTRRSRGNAYIHVVYEGKEKELIFSCDTEIEKYSNVYIEVAKGFFGFDVITNKTLIAGQW